MPAAFSTHFIFIDLITLIIFGEEYRSLSSSLCRLLHSPVTSFLLGHEHLILKALSPRSFLNVRDQVAHPYKTTCRIIFLYILSLYFGISN
jgi:hypothetical protein